MAEKQISVLKKSRGQIKAQLTRAFNFFSDFDTQSQSIEAVEVRLSAIDAAWKEFQAKQDELEELDATFENDNERERFENYYYAAAALAKSIIAEKNRSVVRANSTSLNSTIQGNATAATFQFGDTSARLKLPTIMLPTFEGSYEQWPSFRDTFKALIDENESLSDIKRLYYLQSTLKGVAAEVIASMELSAANYQVAWELLKIRFENTRVLVQHHLQALIDFPEIKSESHATLRQLLDMTEKHVRALKNLGQPTDAWSTILVYLMTVKLDNVTKREWETKISSREVPTYTQFIDFITSRCIMLESLQLEDSRPLNSNDKKAFTSKRSVAAVATESERANKRFKTRFGCPMCKDTTHKVFHCPSLQRLSPQLRAAEIKRLNLCFNCLKGGHTLEACMFGTCRICNKKHNTLLHVDRVESSASDTFTSTASGTQVPPSTSQVLCSVQSADRGLLATAIVQIRDNKGELQDCRAFLDPGSQSNFITSQLCEQLQLPQQKKYLPIHGIQNTQAAALTGCHATIQSKVNGFKAKLAFSVLSEITANLPTYEINQHDLAIPSNITLADPSFHVPSQVDLLLGSSIVWELLCVGQIKLGKNRPIAQKTKLGWIIAGPLDFPAMGERSNSSACSLANTTTIEHQLERFWHVEEGVPFSQPSENDKVCEDSFIETHRRNESGRFEVRLPMRGDINSLGESRDIAIKRLKSMERKFVRHPDLKSQYVDFMREYEHLGHMTVASEDEEINGTTYYLPHHCVIKEDSLTTKLRVVFDASCPSSSGVSLNDILRSGPTIQQDLLSILLRFRQHRYVVTADVQKMYRQVLLQDDQRDLQRIVWREDPSEPVQNYRLNTVTYGLASAPFLAIRCLHQLAITNQHEYPEASNTILNDFYVDDLLTGSNDPEALKRICQQIASILSSAGLILCKWNTNNPTILNSADETMTLPIGDEIKTLGVCWKITDDCLQYKTESIMGSSRATKRSILSTVAQIFDPLGLMGPTIVCAKIILQKIWQLKIGWDESLPFDLHTMWTDYRERIGNINSISILRHVTCLAPQRIEIHGFSDASEAAYGGCIYIRSMDETKGIVVRLLCAKSKVAPLKRISLPRLELCGALLLTKLGKVVSQSLTIKIDSIHYWSDSTIALAWIHHRPEELQTFVANRVAEIQRMAPEIHWAHVRSKDNPADVLSRGSTPDALKVNELWWSGPTWLSREVQHWPSEPNTVVDSLPELKPQTIVLHTSQTYFDLINRYSSLSRLKRVTAYCLRFKENAIKKVPKLVGPPTVVELEKAMMKLVHMVQSTEFAAELTDLRAGREVHSSSKLIALRPFLDADGIIRVGGRIRHSEVDYSQRHPILLPAKHPFSKLVIRDAHLRQLHIGPQGLLAHIRQRFWILSGRQAVRRVLRKCIVCFRVKPRNAIQLMGDLPKCRVTPARAFLNSGLDYAGPFSIKISRNKTGKAYLCIFVCCATKATHLELVSDLSTTAFLNALKRFFARRGKSAKLLSDNGSNFIGANNELKALTDMLQREHEKIETFLGDQDIQWSFIPPYSPHMGGLWEAAVKSAKSHLRRVVGNTPLTFEELSTIFAQIESVLNSRPLCPMSDDPQDETVLTPGHFLIGEPLSSFPEPNLSEVPNNRLTRFQLLSQMRQNFWTRWSQEYLTQLQHRYKWQKPNYESIKIGALVLLKDNEAPPLKWRMARVIDTHAGTDNYIRVVSVRTSSGVTKRAINKICVLPIEFKQ